MAFCVMRFESKQANSIKCHKDCNRNSLGNWLASRARLSNKNAAKFDPGLTTVINPDA
jgi:hypothetical protein